MSQNPPVKSGAIGTKIALLFFFLATLAVAIYLSVRYAEDEADYHLRQLRMLAEQPLTATQGGLAVDDSIEQAKVHRDKLVQLGVMFSKVYNLGEMSRSLEEHRHLAHYFWDGGYPASGYWELSIDGQLGVWDVVENESEWDKFVKGYSLAQQP